MNGLVLSFQLAAFSCQILATVPDADTAVAVAVGLARMSRPDEARIEWAPSCGEHGCRLVPRVVLPEAPLAASQLGKDAAADSSTNSAAASTSCSDGRCEHGNRRIFGRRR